MRRKELSNFTTDPVRRFTLPKSQILRGRRNFEELFTSSSILTASNVTLRYATYPDAGRKYMVGFIAPKKIGNAVQRIRTKRLLKEAYRLNQHILTELPDIANIGLHYAFLAKHADLTYDSVQQDVTQLMKALREKLLSKYSPN